MPVPDYQSLMLPVLQAVGDGATHKASDIAQDVALALHLSADDIAEVLPSGKQKTFSNRVGWSLTYLTLAALLRRPQRAHYEITEQGKNTLASGVEHITVAYLKQFPEFMDYLSKAPLKHVPVGKVGVGESTPSEQMEDGYQTIRAELAQALLEQVLACPPAFFEQLVVDLLVAMGYGGSIADAGKAVGHSGDGGVDGVIKEDRLGLEEICIQAKRLSGGSVGRDTVQAFAGSLEGRRARKGVFITTAKFSPKAVEYVGQIEKRIVLIDGQRLAELMMDHGIGVTDVVAYTVQRLDTDYFDEA